MSLALYKTLAVPYDPERHGALWSRREDEGARDQLSRALLGPAMAGALRYRDGLDEEELATVVGDAVIKTLHSYNPSLGSRPGLLANIVARQLSLNTIRGRKFKGRSAVSVSLEEPGIQLAAEEREHDDTPERLVAHIRGEIGRLSSPKAQADCTERLNVWLEHGSASGKRLAQGRNVGRKPWARVVRQTRVGFRLDRDTPAPAGA